MGTTGGGSSVVGRSATEEKNSIIADFHMHAFNFCINIKQF